MEGTRVCATDFTMPNLSTVKTSSISMALPWEWIVEKLVDMKEIGMPLFKAMIMNVADFNNPSCKSLQERVALRYVEEILLLDKIEAHAIPPVKLLISSSLPSSNAVHDLLLRVCTEGLPWEDGCILSPTSFSIQQFVLGARYDSMHSLLQESPLLCSRFKYAGT